MESEPNLADLDGVSLSFHDLGPKDAQPVLLVHGFASNARVNWFMTGWVADLLAAGRRVVAFDNRGHGGSSKFYDASEYGPDIFATDAVKLLNYMDIPQADVVGYSMGGRIAFALAVWHGHRVRKAAICGMGANLFGRREGSERVAEVLEADEVAEGTDPRLLQFRRFAERTGSDRLALAACIRPSSVVLTPEQARTIQVPVIVAVGSDDETAGPAEPLADAIPGARSYTAPGKDHMKATGDAGLKRAVIDFLAE